MREFRIVTDSSCDLTSQLAEQMNIEAVPLTVVMDKGNFPNYLDERALRCVDFYQYLRNCLLASTSAVNVDQFLQAMDNILAEVLDFL